MNDRPPQSKGRKLLAAELARQGLTSDRINQEIEGLEARRQGRPPGPNWDPDRPSASQRLSTKFSQEAAECRTVYLGQQRDPKVMDRILTCDPNKAPDLVPR
jgi:hypothetical protein